MWRLHTLIYSETRRSDKVMQRALVFSILWLTHLMMTGLKKMNDWPTYPQFIVNGEFVGGLDVVTEMSSEEFAEVFTTA